jgi:hypothetical protein
MSCFLWSPTAVGLNNNGWMLLEAIGTLTRVADITPSTLTEDIMPMFKQHARIDFPDDDDLCKLYLNAAMSRIEQWTGMPVKFATYEWLVGENYQTYEMYQLPLRNTVMAGMQHGFDDYQAPKWVPAPSVWPLEIEVGFATGADMPDDIKLSTFELALSLYQQRSNTEMINVYAETIMAGNLSRYYVPRV